MERDIMDYSDNFNLEEKLKHSLQDNNAFLIRNGIKINREKYNRILYSIIHGITYYDGKLIVSQYFCEGDSHINLDIVGGK